MSIAERARFTFRVAACPAMPEPEAQNFDAFPEY
jgi:hypothetical protein